MRFLKKTMSAVLSIFVISNFTFCRALEQPANLEENKKSSSVFSYIIAGVSAVVSAIGFFALYNFLFSGNSDQNSESNKKHEPFILNSLNDKNNLISADVNSGNDNDYDEDKQKKDIQKNPEFFSFDLSENGATKKEENHGLGKPLRVPGVSGNIKAIHWNKHRCWWIASVLFLYYWSDFKGFIYDNAGNKFASVQNENCKSVLMDLNDIFKILDQCDGNICYITEDENRMNNYFSNLKKLESIAVVENDDNYPLLVDLLYFTFQNEPALKKFNLTAAESAVYNDKFTGKLYNVKFMLSNINGGHFYVYLLPYSAGKGFAIGRSTLPDEETISICDLAWNNHAHWPLVKVFKEFKQ